MKNGPSPRASSARRSSKPPPPTPDTSAATRGRMPPPTRTELAIEKIEADARGNASSSVEARARACIGLIHAAHETDDDELFEASCGRQSEVYRLLSANPAGSTQDLSHKLAVLMMEMLRTSSGEPEPKDLALLASALADAVMLSSGPLAVPPGPPK